MEGARLVARGGGRDLRGSQSRHRRQRVRRLAAGWTGGGDGGVDGHRSARPSGGGRRPAGDEPWRGGEWRCWCWCGEGWKQGEERTERKEMGRGGVNG